MGFVWLINPVPGDKIASDDVQEIRDNTDWIADNLANFTHDLGHNTSKMATDDSSNQSPYYAAHESGYDAALNSTYKNAILSDNNSVHYTSDDINQKATHCGTHHPSYNAVDFGSEV